MARIDQSAGELADEPVFDQLPATVRSPSPRPAASGLITAARPFAWHQQGRSAGDLPFELYRSGQDGFRTLVVGSVGGHDPGAVRLVDELARHLHQQDLILGGFQTVVIRTLNPDGARSRSFLNAGGKYVNHHFPAGLQSASAAERSVPEVAFGLEQIRTLRPQRIIHVRTIKGSQGVIAADASAASSAQEVADWLGFALKPLPATAAQGSLEQCVSDSGSVQMLTVAIPEAMPPDQVWSFYGDSLLNLLLGDDFQSREIARQRRKSSSANARFRNPPRP